MTYRTGLANDVQGVEYGYVIHLVYGCKASPSEKTNSTINDSPEANTMSWEFTTTPVNVTGHKPTSHIEIDSTKVDPTQLKALEDLLYGTDEAEAQLPTPDEVAALFKAA